jgi:hypothetical protein
MADGTGLESGTGSLIVDVDVDVVSSKEILP